MNENFVGSIVFQNFSLVYSRSQTFINVYVLKALLDDKHLVLIFSTYSKFILPISDLSSTLEIHKMLKHKSKFFLKSCNIRVTLVHAVFENYKHCRQNHFFFGEIQPTHLVQEPEHPLAEILKKKFSSCRE